jgi:hypothetical protein
MRQTSAEIYFAAALLLFAWHPCNATRETFKIRAEQGEQGLMRSEGAVLMSRMRGGRALVRERYSRDSRIPAAKPDE